MKSNAVNTLWTQGPGIFQDYNSDKYSWFWYLYPPHDIMSPLIPWTADDKFNWICCFYTPLSMSALSVLFMSQTHIPAAWSFRSMRHFEVCVESHTCLAQSSGRRCLLFKYARIHVEVTQKTVRLLFGKRLTWPSNELLGTECFGGNR